MWRYLQKVSTQSGGAKIFDTKWRCKNFRHKVAVDWAAFIFFDADVAVKCSSGPALEGGEITAARFVPRQEDTSVDPSKGRWGSGLKRPCQQGLHVQGLDSCPI